MVTKLPEKVAWKAANEREGKNTVKKMRGDS
jgi:hypothetical protein